MGSKNSEEFSDDESETRSTTFCATTILLRGKGCGGVDEVVGTNLVLHLEF